MKITKQQFLLFIAGMFVLAGLFTWWIGIDTVFDRSQPVEIFYLAGASIIVFYLWHLGLVVPAVAVSYGASLFFCFFYFAARLKNRKPLAFAINIRI